jgi:glycerol uptake facilitator-like aquaporin
MIVLLVYCTVYCTAGIFGGHINPEQVISMYKSNNISLLMCLQPWAN